MALAGCRDDGRANLNTLRIVDDPKSAVPYAAGFIPSLMMIADVQ
jgi:hypothetical protein